MKKFYGGIFVLINLAVCIFYSIEHLIIPFEQTLGKVIGAWIFLLCSATIYVFLKSAITSQNYSLIAGYNPHKKYDEAVLSKLLKSFLISSSFSALFYSLLYLLMPFVTTNAQSLFGGALTAVYIVNLAGLVLFLNRRYANTVEIR